MKHRVVGTWRIVEMDLWDRDAIELLGPALLEFRADGTVTLGFIAVEGYVDWKPRAAHVTERVEFSWAGNDEGDAVSGRGWAEIAEDGSLHGRIFFHLGDDAGFRASPPSRELSIGALWEPSSVYPTTESLAATRPNDRLRSVTAAAEVSG